jgi:hypothetical protein
MNVTSQGFSFAIPPAVLPVRLIHKRGPRADCYSVECSSLY